MSTEPQDGGLGLLQFVLNDHLTKIEEQLPADYRLTLVCRNTKNQDAHILMTKDDLDEVLEAIQRLKGEGS